MNYSHFSKAADNTYLVKFEKALCKIKGFFIPQRELDFKFLIAVLNDDLDSVKYWLNCGANINAIQDYSEKEIRTYLNFFSINNIHNEFKYDIRNFWEIKKDSALMIAKSFKMIKYLIENGTDVNYKKHLCYKTLLNLDTYYTTTSTVQKLITNSIIDGDPRIAIAALEAGVMPDEKAISNLRRQNPIDPTAEIIWNFIQKPRIKSMDETLQFMPKALTDLVSEYM